MTFGSAVLLLISGTQAQVAQVGNGVFASAKVSCLVVAPIGISKVRDMYFGNIISGSAGSIVLSPEGGRAVINGNVALESDRGAVSSASFEITDGLENNPETQRFFEGFSVTLPSDDVTLVNETGSTMLVSNFTSSHSPGVGTLVNRTGVLTVGATLHVNAEQELGNYASITPFPVTVNFY